MDRPLFLGDEVTGYLRASELSMDRVEDARAVLSDGQEVEAAYVGVDRKNGTVNLSVKALESKDHDQAVKDYGATGEATTNLGDLLKQQMEEGKEED